MSSASASDASTTNRGSVRETIREVSAPGFGSSVALSEGLHPLLGEAFAAFDRANLRWCLLRVPSNAARPSGDVDLLVEKTELRVARDVLAELGFAALPGVGSGTECMFFNYHAPTDHWIVLHIVTELGFGRLYELRSDAESACLRRVRRDGRFVRLAAADEFWVTLLHCLLDKGAVQPRRRDGLQQLATDECMSSPVVRAVLMACPPQWSPERLLQAVGNGDWDALERLAPILETIWRKRVPARAKIANVLGRVRRIPRRLARAYRRRGLSMAVLGPDGAGKSTLAEGVRKSFCRPVRIIYMGFGGQGRPPLLTRLRLPGVGAPGHLLVLWWQCLKALYLRLQGYLVIFDRYSYDTLASPPHQQQNWLSRFGSWVKAHTCPKPHLVIVLDAPGQTMFERKGELNANVLEAQRQRFVALRERLREVRIVDASLPKDAVRIEVLTYLWRAHQSHWG